MWFVYYIYGMYRGQKRLMTSSDRMHVSFHVSPLLKSMRFIPMIENKTGHDSHVFELGEVKNVKYCL